MVRCEICGKELKAMTWSHLLLHNITFADYKRMYPNSETMDESLRERYIEIGRQTKITEEGKGVIEGL